MKTGDVYRSIGRFRLVLVGIAVLGLAVEGCRAALTAGGGGADGVAILTSTGPAGGSNPRDVEVNLTFRWLSFTNAPHIRNFSGSRMMPDNVSVAWDITGWTIGRSLPVAGAATVGLPLAWESGDFPLEEDDGEGELVEPVFTDGTRAIWVEVVVRPGRLAMERALSADPSRLVGIPRIFFEYQAAPVVDMPLMMFQSEDPPDFERTSLERERRRQSFPWGGAFPR